MKCPSCKSESGFDGGKDEGYACGNCGHRFKLNAKGKVIAGKVHDEEEPEEE